MLESAWQWVSEPFSVAINQRALAAVLIAGAGCAWVGVHIILRRMSFFGDALAHATLPGVLLAFVCGIPLLIGALVSSLLAAVGVTWVTRRRETNEDSAIGVLYTGLFAVGIIGLSRVNAYTDLTHILLGNPMAVTSAELWLMLVVCAVVMLVLFLTHRLLALTVMDPEYARSVGVSPDLARGILLVACAMVVVVALSVVGIILTVALLITPAATARLLGTRLTSVIAIALGLAFLSGIVGFLLAYHLSWPAGAAIVATASMIFVVVRVLVALPRRGRKDNHGL